MNAIFSESSLPLPMNNFKESHNDSCNLRVNLEHLNSLSSLSGSKSTELSEFLLPTFDKINSKY